MQVKQLAFLNQSSGDPPLRGSLGVRAPYGKFIEWQCIAYEGAGSIYVPQPPSGNFPGKSILNLPDPPTVWAARPAGKKCDFIFGTHPPPSGETARGIPWLALIVDYLI